MVVSLPARSSLKGGSLPTIRVFLSVGRVSTPAQERFVEDFEVFLRGRGLTPHTVGRTRFTAGAPLQTIMGDMSTSAGTAILAFERKRVDSGIELGALGKDDADLSGARYPTVWNQIEAAMAYTLGHPLFVVVEEGLRSEGLLERGYDWWVQSVPIGPEVMEGAEFLGIFADWQKRVEERARRFLVEDAT